MTTRRTTFKCFILAGAILALSPMLDLSRAQDSQPRKKILFFSKSAGYQHSVITRPSDNPTRLSHAEQILTDIAGKEGFDVICSKDGRDLSPQNIKSFDAFAFYTTGDLTQDSDKYEMKKDADGKPTQSTGKLLWKEPAMPPGAKEALLDAIHDGKGFVGFHSASNTFQSPGFVKNSGNLLRDINEKGEDEFDPYIKMLGGEFVIHGKQQHATLECVDKNFPGAAAFDDARFGEEWYSLKNFASDLHVILVQDTFNMSGAMYQRPRFPMTWARMHGQGRVFYTSLGHREDVWERKDFHGLIIGALKWTTGQANIDVKPNIKQATPDAEVKPPAKTP